ncbi:transferrin-binding protein-like solute binding protein [Actinobacillus equuli subsp. equuli]|uniref:Transferrin-binding protein-like solute binding protein n=1 Tax=Actinobacillus equuli subsp. equuli TaxID=202947 RepID=A0A9X4JD04_ACTEU|nr:transferrin-binding protein-like solute binding protein [Actinobacillus equuli]MDE8034423.1 transferrin-binding protein-like solute binding protein [Actinobacillus equuli subsp. equuli]
MNKNLRLSLIAIACSLAITACSSDNKGATRYENLVKNKTEEATKQAEEKAKRAQESDTAKKLADLEKKQKELEAELAKKNGNAAVPSVGSDVPKVPNNVITPSTPAKEKDAEEKATEKKESKLAPYVTETPAKTISSGITTSEAKIQLQNGLKNNGIKDDVILLSGATSTNVNKDGFKISDISNSNIGKLDLLVVDGQNIVLYSPEGLKTGRIDETKIIQDMPNGKVSSLPKSNSAYDFEQMRYGYVTVNGQTNLFIQGFMTPNGDQTEAKSPFNYYYERRGNSSTQRLTPMPTDGVFEYHGKAFYGKDNSYEELDTKAYADITNKKVQITLSSNNESKFTFGGIIKDNEFSGTVGDIVTKGAFYGKNAQDIGGLFYNTSESKNGVYGASQDCNWSGCKKPADDFNLKTFNITE